MAKRSYGERIVELSQKKNSYLEKANNIDEQIKDLEKKEAEDNRKKRNHRLIEIGAAVESVLGHPIEIENIPKLIGFLRKQDENGNYFSKAMGVEVKDAKQNM